MFDGAAFGKEIVTSVRAYLERTIEPVLKRIEELESDIPMLIADARLVGKDGAPGRDGNDGKDGQDGRDGVDGQDADLVAPDDIAVSIATAVRMLAHMPDTKDAPPASQLNIHFPAITMPELKLPDNVVNVSLPRRGAERVEVTEHSEDGRIKSYVKTPIDEA